MTIPAKWQDHEGLADAFDSAMASPFAQEMRAKMARQKKERASFEATLERLLNETPERLAQKIVIAGSHSGKTTAPVEPVALWPSEATASDAITILKDNAETITFCAHCNEPMTGAKCQHCEGRFQK